MRTPLHIYRNTHLPYTSVSHLPHTHTVYELTTTYTSTFAFCRTNTVCDRRAGSL